MSQVQWFIDLIFWPLTQVFYNPHSRILLSSIVLYTTQPSRKKSAFFQISDISWNRYQLSGHDGPVAADQRHRGRGGQRVVADLRVGKADADPTVSPYSPSCDVVAVPGAIKNGRAARCRFVQTSRNHHCRNTSVVLRQPSFAVLLEQTVAACRCGLWITLVGEVDSPHCRTVLPGRRLRTRGTWRWANPATPAIVLILISGFQVFAWLGSLFWGHQDLELTSRGCVAKLC